VYPWQGKKREIRGKKKEEREKRKEEETMYEVPSTKKFRQHLKKCVNDRKSYSGIFLAIQKA
jgi:hypothetical protein